MPWTGAPASEHDPELFNAWVKLGGVPVGDLAAVPVDWLVGPALTPRSAWTSPILDMGGSPSGLWSADFKAELLDRSGVAGWSDLPVDFLGTLDVGALTATDATVEVVVTVGLQPDLSDGTAFRGTWIGRARYVQVAVTVVTASWVVEARVDNLMVRCDAPDVIDFGTVTLATSPQTVPFAKTFQLPPAVTAASSAVSVGAPTTTGFPLTGTVGAAVSWFAHGV